LRWRFEPKPEAFAQGVACCDVVNRGVAYEDGKVFLNTLDNQTIALDATSGKELWRYRSETSTPARRDDGADGRQEARSDRQQLAASTELAAGSTR
jgi:glucose dehydrogenase